MTGDRPVITAWSNRLVEEELARLDELTARSSAAAKFIGQIPYSLGFGRHRPAC
jgi:hypothetical protein